MPHLVKHHAGALEQALATVHFGSAFSLARFCSYDQRPESTWSSRTPLYTITSTCRQPVERGARAGSLVLQAGHRQISCDLATDDLASPLSANRARRMASGAALCRLIGCLAYFPVYNGALPHQAKPAALSRAAATAGGKNKHEEGWLLDCYWLRPPRRSRPANHVTCSSPNR